MEVGEQIQQDEGWQSILPNQELPEGVDTWMIDVPDVGKLFTTLEQKPGSGGYADDDKAFVLNPDVPGLSANGEELLGQGFRTLHVALTPKDREGKRLVELRLKGTDLCFESVLQRHVGESILKALSYWTNVKDTSEYPAMRDLMVKRKQLKDIQVRFPKKDKIELKEYADWDQLYHDLMGQKMIAAQILGEEHYFDIPLPHLATRRIVYELEFLTKGADVAKFLEEHKSKITDRVRREKHGDGAWHRLQAIQAAMNGDYSKVKSYYFALADTFAGHARHTIGSQAGETQWSLAVKRLSEDLPESFEEFSLPRPAWEDPVIIEANKRRIEEGGDLI